MLELKGVSKDRGELRVLRGVDLVVSEGEVLVIRGRSGSGKSTLLRICAMLDDAFEGELRFMGRRRADRLRLIGYVPQSIDLIETLTLRENIELPLRLAGVKDDGRPEKMADELEIGHLLDRFPAQVSGGEAQRAAIARALVKRPKMIVADEPTSNLDERLEEMVLLRMAELAREGGSAAIVSATSEPAAPGLAVRVMKDGVLL